MKRPILLLFLLLAQLAFFAYNAKSTQSRLASAEIISLPVSLPDGYPDTDDTRVPVQTMIMANQWQLGRSIKIEFDDEFDDELRRGPVIHHDDRADVVFDKLLKNRYWRYEESDEAASHPPCSSFAQPDDKAADAVIIEYSPSSYPSIKRPKNSSSEANLKCFFAYYKKGQGALLELSRIEYSTAPEALAGEYIVALGDHLDMRHYILRDAEGKESLQLRITLGYNAPTWPFYDKNPSISGENSSSLPYNLDLYHLGGGRYVPKALSRLPLEPLLPDIDNLKKNTAK